MTDQRQFHHPLPPPPPSQPQDDGRYYNSDPSSAYAAQPYQHQQQLQEDHHQQQQQPSSYPAQQRQQQQQSQPARPAARQTKSSSSQQTPGTKPRTLSFQSNHSHKSSGSKPENSYETHAEKESRRLHSKADPTMAISEAEPSAVAAMTKSSLAPLRSIQHRDSWGNSISEPDRSNPTRSRWERPLDTIRSFEAAVDGSYSRKSMVRSGTSGHYPPETEPQTLTRRTTDTDSVAQWNRRSSYYGGSESRRHSFAPRSHAKGNVSDNGPRFPQGGHQYGGRPASMMRPESNYMDYQHGNRSAYFDPSGQDGGPGGYGQNGYGAGPSRQRPPRTMTEPANVYGRGGDQGVYPMPNKDRSYETVTTAAGSGTSGEQAGYQTDPTSSDNSSIERRSPAKRQQQPPNDYGIGFNQGSNSFQPPAFNNFANGARKPLPGQQQPQQAPQNQMAPPPVPVKNGAGGGMLRKQSTQKRPDVGEKRKSWFSRRFSKNA